MKHFIGVLFSMFAAAAALSTKVLALGLNPICGNANNGQDGAIDQDDQKLMECLEKGIGPTFCQEHFEHVEHSHSGT